MRNRNKKLILAIDDRPDLLATVSEMLEEYYTVIGVKDYFDAMEVMEKQMPELFLLDIEIENQSLESSQFDLEIPQFSGYEIATLIRADDKFKNKPILFLTGKATKDSVIKAYQSGGNDYIAKPVKRTILLKKIRKYLPEE